LGLPDTGTVHPSNGTGRFEPIARAPGVPLRGAATADGSWRTVIASAGVDFGIALLNATRSGPWSGNAAPHRCLARPGRVGP
jgi:hypothetical protein